MRNQGPITYRRLKSGGYELLDHWWVDTGIKGSAARVLDRKTAATILEMDQEGRLTIAKGYRWDGASGPVIDRRANMRAGLAHDGLYQLHRAGKLGLDLRADSDRVYRELYLACGGWGFVGWIDYIGLRGFAGYAAKPKAEVETKRLAA